MPKKEFDPHKFIDREFEQELFEELLQLKDQARILAIRDAGGMGKSQLLQKFQYRCRTVKPRIPVSLIALDLLPDNSPLALMQEIEKDLSALLEFPTFTATKQPAVPTTLPLFAARLTCARPICARPNISGLLESMLNRPKR